MILTTFGVHSVEFNVTLDPSRFDYVDSNSEFLQGDIQTNETQTLKFLNRNNVSLWGNTVNKIQTWIL